jgi:hypothetical protein
VKQMLGGEEGMEQEEEDEMKWLQFDNIYWYLKRLKWNKY